MSVRYLEKSQRAYRIGDPDGVYPIFDATGSTLAPGRWNNRYTPVIYAAMHYSTAMLAKLAYLAGLMPPNQQFIGIDLPQGLSYTEVKGATLPNWADANQAAARNFGVNWATACESALLFVPSYVARMEWNVVINPRHEQFSEISTTDPQPIWWDDRLFL